jgi:hypothetical protein
MSSRGPTDGREASVLAGFRALGPREQRAWLDALARLADGQPAEDYCTEMFVELGYDPEPARQKVQKLLRAGDGGDDGWRDRLI